MRLDEIIAFATLSGWVTYSHTYERGKLKGTKRIKFENTDGSSCDIFHGATMLDINIYTFKGKGTHEIHTSQTVADVERIFFNGS